MADSKQPATFTESYDAFMALPVPVQAEIIAGPTYLLVVKRARQHVPTHSLAVGIGNMLSIQLRGGQ